MEKTIKPEDLEKKGSIWCDSDCPVKGNHIHKNER